MPLYVFFLIARREISFVDMQSKKGKTTNKAVLTNKCLIEI